MLLMAACAGSSPGSLVGATPAPFSFGGTITLHGEIAAQGSFDDTVTLRHETCAEYVAAAAPATTLWVVPTPNTGTPVGGHAIMYTAGIPQNPPSRGYHGPGTYSSPSALVSVLLVDNASFLPGATTAATISISADGSGSLSFTGLVDTSSDALESGRVEWTCRD